MNQLKAMEDTVILMDRKIALMEYEQEREFWRRAMKLNSDLRPQHIKQMLVVMTKGDNPQHPGEAFGEAKMGRWLGWAQAAVVALGLGTLDEMKEINKRWSGK